jgi:transmembrane sensor
MKPELKAIEQSAAEWLARREAGLSARQEAEFARWLEADCRHAESYRAVQQSWSQLDRLRGSSTATRLETELDDLRISEAERIPSAVTRPIGLRARPWISGALAAGVVWLVAYVAWWRPQQTHAPYGETAATDIGMARTMELPDGSTIQLNTDSAVDVLFTKTERRVRLSRGEALFKIAKNPARPFIVNAAGVNVRAVGTEFNVRLKSEALEVVVREGKVRVDDAASGETLLSPPAGIAGTGKPQARETSPPILGAGQRLTLPVMAAPKIAVSAAAPEALAALEIERSLAWQTGRLVFESAPLSEIIAEFNRYNRRQLIIDEAELAARRFGGTFVANDLDTFVELLRASHNVTVEMRAHEIGLRARK